MADDDDGSSISDDSNGAEDITKNPGQNNNRNETKDSNLGYVVKFSEEDRKELERIHAKNKERTAGFAPIFSYFPEEVHSKERAEKIFKDIIEDGLEDLLNQKEIRLCCAVYEEPLDSAEFKKKIGEIN